MKVTIYHNRRCTKSRETLQILKEAEELVGFKTEIIEYLKSPPDVNTLTKILDKLKMSPRELMRHKESAYRSLNLDDESLNNRSLIQAMVENPILIERPIVLVNDKAIIGRPPNSVHEIL